MDRLDSALNPSVASGQACYLHCLILNFLSKRDEKLIEVECMLCIQFCGLEWFPKHQSRNLKQLLIDLCKLLLKKCKQRNPFREVCCEGLQILIQKRTSRPHVHLFYTQKTPQAICTSIYISNITKCFASVNGFLVTWCSCGCRIARKCLWRTHCKHISNNRLQVKLDAYCKGFAPGGIFSTENLKKFVPIIKVTAIVYLR